MKKIQILFIGSICIALLSLSCYASLKPISELTAIPGVDAGGFYIELSWNATQNNDPLDTQATFVYSLYVRPGQSGLSPASSDSQSIGTTGSTTFKWYPASVQDYSFIVYAEEAGGSHVGDSIYSNIAVSPFIYSVVRSEGSGGKSWNFTFLIEENAYVNVYIYAPDTILNEDTYGHPVHNALYNSYIRRVVYKQAMSGGLREVTWDCKDDTGNYVSNLIYPVLIEAMANDTEVIGKWWGTVAVNISASEIGAFEGTVHCYPNPAKGKSITFTYFVGTAPADITIEVYSITGELIWSKTKTENKTGSLTEVWNCINNSGNPIGSDIYIYRITKKEGSSTTTVTKKLVYVK